MNSTLKKLGRGLPSCRVVQPAHILWCCERKVWPDSLSEFSFNVNASFNMPLSKIRALASCFLTLARGFLHLVEYLARLSELISVNNQPLIKKWLEGKAIATWIVLIIQAWSTFIKLPLDKTYADLHQWLRTRSYQSVGRTDINRDSITGSRFETSKALFAL